MTLRTPEQFRQALERLDMVKPIKPKRDYRALYFNLGFLSALILIAICWT